MKKDPNKNQTKTPDYFLNIDDLVAIRQGRRSHFYLCIVRRDPMEFCKINEDVVVRYICSEDNPHSCISLTNIDLKPGQTVRLVNNGKTIRCLVKIITTSVCDCDHYLANATPQSEGLPIVGNLCQYYRNLFTDTRRAIALRATTIFTSKAVANNYHLIKVEVAIVKPSNN